MGAKVQVPLLSNDRDASINVSCDVPQITINFQFLIRMFDVARVQYSEFAMCKQQLHGLRLHVCVAFAENNWTSWGLYPGLPAC